jgi:ribosomal protein S27E
VGDRFYCVARALLVQHNKNISTVFDHTHLIGACSISSTVCIMPEGGDLSMSVGGHCRATLNMVVRRTAHRVPMQRRPLRRHGARLRRFERKMVLCWAAVPPNTTPSSLFQSEALDVAVALASIAG